MLSQRAISYVDTDENFSRIISRASHIPVRSAGIDPPLGLPKDLFDQANGGAVNDPGRDHSSIRGAIISESREGIIPLRGAASSRNWRAASWVVGQAVLECLPRVRRSLGARPSSGGVFAGESNSFRDMSRHFRPWKIDQTQLLPPAIADYVPGDHLAQFVVALAREHLDLSEIVASYKSGLGQPPFDPRLMTALLLYAYCSGLYSSRRIAKACADESIS